MCQELESDLLGSTGATTAGVLSALTLCMIVGCQVVLRGLRVALREMEKAVDAASEEPDQRTAFAVLKCISLLAQCLQAGCCAEQRPLACADEKLPGAGIEDYKSDAKEVVKQQGRHMLAWFEGKEAAWFEHDAHEHVKLPPSFFPSPSLRPHTPTHPAAPS